MTRDKLLFLFYVLFFTAILSSCASSPPTGGTSTPTISTQQTPTAIASPAQTPTPTISGLEGCATALATNFYQAIKDKNNQKAYTYLAPSATGADGQKLTYATFTQLVASSEIANKAFTMTIGGFTQSPPTIVTTIDNGQLRYHSHLGVISTGTTCSISSLDRV